ncbi:helix-turn-helix transcriptional regulator [Salisediminibacterium beveridgei]|uniref:Transcriptional regulator, Cro/CI family n=1 Tax=Salisediminibacterium beveridgei TaxID=632773 RepID=A0A1D7QZA3_9BACI|nr:helix-turn-helix transcriptional regulator [Salisediminibacterium beveridgei]AOM84352.1 Transcriptional regulator, Cro/CI family [Salisediminibacterium beveridgei]
MKNNIKVYRLQYNMTQKELADQVHVSSRTIISLEKGKYKPSLMLAYRIACFFEVTIEELFCLQENKELEDLHDEHIQQ